MITAGSETGVFRFGFFVIVWETLALYKYNVSRRLYNRVN